MSITGVDPIYESDGDELGGLMGWLLYGDVTHDDLELFLANDEPDEFFPDGVDGGWEVEEVYVHKVPREWGTEYVYASGPAPGARKATKVEQNHSWGHWCVKHIYEPASAGIPVEQVKDPVWPLVLNGYVYLCRPCRTSFSERYEAARREALAALRESA